MLLCLYTCDFYQLSSNRRTTEENFSVVEAVRVTDPKPFLLTKTSEASVNTLPGAIQSDSKSFDIGHEPSPVRNANTLPGAIGQQGSFDNHGEGLSKGVGYGPKPSRHAGSADGKRNKSRGMGRLKMSRAQSNSASSAPKSTLANKQRGTKTGISYEKSPDVRNVRGSLSEVKRRKKKRKLKKNLSSRTSRKKQKGSTKGSSGKASTAIKSGRSKKPIRTSGEELESKSDVDKDSHKKPLDETDVPIYSGPHPMNRNMEQLQVDGGTGKLNEDGVQAAYRKLVQAYLAPFRAGIKRRSFFEVLRRKTYSLAPPGSNKGIQTILFQIVDRSACVHVFSFLFWQY